MTFSYYKVDFYSSLYLFDAYEVTAKNFCLSDNFDIFLAISL